MYISIIQPADIGLCWLFNAIYFFSRLEIVCAQLGSMRAKQWLSLKRVCRLALTEALARWDVSRSAARSK